MKKTPSIVLGILIAAVVLFFGAKSMYQQGPLPEREIQSSVFRAPQEKLVAKWSPTLGPTMARVTVVEFLDPECETCRAMHPIVKNVLRAYEGRIQYVVRYMPFHQNSALAASWLEAAREQEKYWEALDILFAQQPQWAAHHAPNPALIPGFLKTVGVNIAKATVAKDNPEFMKRLEADRQDGFAVGVNGTPTFFINGRMLTELGEAPLRALIEEELRAPAL